MHKTAVRSTLAVGMVFAAGIALSACASSSSSSSPTPTAAAGAVDLSGVCPATVTIQTDWNPESEHGHLYQLLGPNPVINADKKSVSGDLYYMGKSTGVKVEIRSGGPAIGFQTVSSQMYQDKSITLGYVTTDEAVQLSNKLPTTAVFAPLDIGPQMIMWDPSYYPNVTDIKSLGAALKKDGGVVRYFGGAAYMDYLTGSGTLDKSVVDGSYDGTPAKFVAAKGKDAQQGFASAEPYIYEKEIPAWGKPVKFQLTNDVGYPVYASAVSVRSAELKSLTPCLTKLVPVLQQTEIDYFKSPAATNKLILDLVTAYNNGWVYTQGAADYSVAEMKKLKLVGNGSNAYMGDMDATRVQKIITIDTPVFTASNSAPKAGIKPSDIFTNEFIDKSIGF
ncbi:MAG: ABC transporter substrate-binding protein [Lacisediminihabitans sp.]